VAEVLHAPAKETAIDVLGEIMRQGYTLTVRTRAEALHHKVGAQTITYADKLQIRGTAPLSPELSEAARAHRDELLAAACVLDPPVGWIATLVERYLEGRVNLAMLANNVAAFVGLHPREGARLAPVIEVALR
jgi:hypothetical protein